MEICTNKTISKKTGASIILGFFDGVHAGHREVIKTAVNYAKEQNTESVLITFKSSPAEFFCTNVPYIYPRNYNYELIQKLGVDYILELDFKEYVNKSAEEYLDILLDLFSPISITTGFNHTFGAKKSGNAEFLERNEAKFGYKYFCTKEYKINSEIVSSTAIRFYLKMGNIEKANQFLKENFSIRSTVIEGNKIGRTLGYPTANMEYPENIVKLPYGVYKVQTLNRPAILNWGVKPTLGGKKEILEVHIPDFEENLYGKELKIEIINKIRDEKKFNNLDELKEQIKKDLECLKL